MSVEVNLGSILNADQELACSRCFTVGLQVSNDVFFTDTLVLKEAITAFCICFCTAEPADGMAAFLKQIIQYPVAPLYQACVSQLS
jgi:hypothetical protein